MFRLGKQRQKGNRGSRSADPKPWAILGIPQRALIKYKDYVDFK